MLFPIFEWQNYYWSDKIREGIEKGKAQSSAFRI